MTAGPAGSGTGLTACVLLALRSGEAWLQIRRAAGIAGGGGLCFPTGTVEPGETPEEAVLREAAEELGVTVRIVAPLGGASFPENGEHVSGFEIEIVSGEIHPDPAEVAEVVWMTVDEIAVHVDRLRPAEVFAARLASPRS